MRRPLEQSLLLLASLELPVVAPTVGLSIASERWQPHGLVDAVLWGMVRPAPLVWAVWGITIAALKRTA